MSRRAACLASVLLACAGPALAQVSGAQVPGAQVSGAQVSGAQVSGAQVSSAQSPVGQTPAPRRAAPQSAVPGYGVSEPGAGRPPPSPEVVAARQAARQACAPDVAKLCADAQAGGGGVMRCVREHRSELSPGCSDAVGALRDARRAAKG